MQILCGTGSCGGLARTDLQILTPTVKQSRDRLCLQQIIRTLQTFVIFDHFFLTIIEINIVMKY